MKPGNRLTPVIAVGLAAIVGASLVALSLIAGEITLPSPIGAPVIPNRRDDSGPVAPVQVPGSRAENETGGRRETQVAASEQPDGDVVQGTRIADAGENPIPVPIATTGAGAPDDPPQGPEEPEGPDDQPTVKPPMGGDDGTGRTPTGRPPSDPNDDDDDDDDDRDDDHGRDKDDEDSDDDEWVPPGQAKKGNDAPGHSGDKTPPGHAKKDNDDARRDDEDEDDGDSDDDDDSDDSTDSHSHTNGNGHSDSRGKGHDKSKHD